MPSRTRKDRPKQPTDAARTPEVAAALVVADLCKAYNGQAVLHHISFALNPGAVTVLLGPNGAGKSTLMRCIVGLSRPDRGHIAVQGAAAETSNAQQRIGYVGEEPFLYRRNSVAEHLEFIARLHRLHAWRQRADELLASLSLDRNLDALPYSLSQGQRRKVALAMALLIDAPVLVLDEPFNGLDPEAQWELREHLLRLRDQGVAVLVSTHRLEEVRSYGDRILILRSGELIEDRPLGAASDAPGDDIATVYFESRGST